MGYLLLIDDDDFLIPQQVRRAFPPVSHRVEVAGTGAAGLEIVQTKRPDVVLLDLLLPDQSGLDVYQQIRRIDAPYPGDLHHHGQEGRRGHQGDEPRGLRLLVQTARPGTVTSSSRRGGRSGAANAHANDDHRDAAQPRR